MDSKKTFRLTRDEETQLLGEMNKLGESNFSNFIRRKLFQMNQSTELSQTTVINQVLTFYDQKIQRQVAVSQLETIFLTLYRIQVLSEESNQVAHEHMKRVMACFRELLDEVSKEFDLSEAFKERWL